MSTEYYPFTGNELSSQIFTPSLDGAVFNCQTRWNNAAQRWYLYITDNSGSVLLNTAMVASPQGTDINLLAGVFSQATMVWRLPDGRLEVTT